LDYIDILQEMLCYIDENIKEKLSVEKLAAHAGFSPYHFCSLNTAIVLKIFTAGHLSVNLVYRRTIYVSQGKLLK